MRSAEARRGGLRTLARFAAPLALLAFAWQVSPVVLWHARFEHELMQSGLGERLHTPTRSPVSTPDAWSEPRVENVSLRLPLRVEDEALCAACTLGCVLPLATGGTVAVFDTPPPEALDEILDQFAPDADDLSIFRTVGRNWQTIDALTDRIRVPGTPPDSFRFVASGSRGVVTRFVVNAVRRYVVYAYGYAGDPARVLGVTGVSEADFDRILSSVQVSAMSAAATARPAECG